MNHLDYPFHFDRRGLTAKANDADHVKDLIEQVLFTVPGERVNRPDFGSGIMQLVFAPNSDQLAGAVQVLVQGSLQQWLGDVIHVNAVVVNSSDATLEVKVDYTIRRTQERLSAEFVRSGT
jgi:uncharacterized protein